MSDNDLDAVIFTSYHNINYYSQFMYCYFGRPYGLVVTKDNITTVSAGKFPFFVISIFFQQSKVQHFNLNSCSHFKKCFLFSCFDVKLILEIARYSLEKFTVFN